MSKIRKISTALSIATALLLKTGCSDDSGGDDSSSNATPNVTALELVGNWQSDCDNTPASASIAAVTYTTASGGGSGIGSGSTRGDSQRTTLEFKQDGTASGLTEYFDATNCNTSFTIGTYRFNITYIIGDDTTTVDSSSAKEINLVDNEIITYSIFQVVSNVELYLGATIRSTPGSDGTSTNKRFDGLGERYNKL